MKKNYLTPDIQLVMTPEEDIMNGSDVDVNVGDYFPSVNED